VGDNWRADVEGARAAGLWPVHLWRHAQHPGDWLPSAPDDPGPVPRIAEVRKSFLPMSPVERVQFV
jgi:hypothetical protein